MFGHKIKTAFTFLVPQRRKGQLLLFIIPCFINSFCQSSTSTTTLMLTASCQDNLCQLVPECQTILDFAAARDDERR